MRCIIHVYLLNEHFSPEHAEAHHGGEASENNLKYEWEDELLITSSVTEVLEHEHATYPLQGTLPDGTAFSHDVAGLFLVEIRSSDAPTTFIGASMSILDSWKKKLDGDVIAVNLFLKDYEPMANPVPGLYIASKEFPKALIL